MDVLKIHSGEDGFADAVAQLAEGSMNEDGRLFAGNYIDYYEGDSVLIDDLKRLPARSIVLGGDMDIARQAFRYFSKNNRNAGIVIFSAAVEHAFLKQLLDESVLRPADIMLVGTRHWNADSYDFVRRNKIKYYSMKEISFEGIEETCNALMSAARMCENIYLLINLDAADPAYAPGADNIVPGGLGSRQFIYLIQRIRLINNIRMVQLLDTVLDEGGASGRLGAKIITEI